MVANYGVTATAVLICILYVPFLLALAGLKPRERKTVNLREPFWVSFNEGLQYVLTTRTTFTAMLITGLFALFIRSVTDILPVVADGVFEKGAAGLGVLTASAGVGALLASVMQLTLPPPLKGKVPPRAFIAVASGPFLMLWLALNESWPVGIFIIAAIGFVTTVGGVNFQTAIQTQIDDDIRGRVMSLWATVALGGTSIGTLLLGGTIEIAGTSLAFLFFGGASLLVFGALFYRLRR